MSNFSDGFHTPDPYMFRSNNCHNTTIFYIQWFICLFFFPVLPKFEVEIKCDEIYNLNRMNSDESIKCKACAKWVNHVINHVSYTCCFQPVMGKSESDRDSNQVSRLSQVDLDPDLDLSTYDPNSVFKFKKKCLIWGQIGTCRVLITTLLEFILQFIAWSLLISQIHGNGVD